MVNHNLGRRGRWVVVIGSVQGGRLVIRVRGTRGAQILGRDGRVHGWGNRRVKCLAFGELMGELLGESSGELLGEALGDLLGKFCAS